MKGFLWVSMASCVLQIAVMAQEAGPTMEEALDLAATGASINLSPSSSWVVTTAETHDGVDAVISTSVGTLSVSATGPGVLDYWVKGSLDVRSWNGLHTPLSDSWQSHQIVLGPNARTFGFARGSVWPAIPGSLVVDEMQVKPFIDLGEALDTELSLAQGEGVAGWNGVASPRAADGIDLAVPAIGDGGVPSVMTTQIVGPGRLSFKLLNAGSDPSGENPFEVFVNGRLVLQARTSEEWQPYVLECGPGEHEVSWQVVMTETQAAVGLDQLTYTGEGSGGLAQALGLPNSQIFLHQESAEVQSLATHDGESAVALLSGVDYPDGQLAMPIEGPALVRYWVQAGYDYSFWSPAKKVSLSESLDRREVRWVQEERVVEEGDHGFQWRMSGSSWNDSDEPGLPVGWIDGVEVEGPIPIAEIPTGGVPFQDSPEHPWLALPAQLAAGGSGVVRTPVVSAGESSWLETTVAGPGRFLFSAEGSRLNIEEMLGREVFTLGANRYAVLLGEGEQTIRWTHSGEGSVWLSGFEMTSLSEGLAGQLGFDDGVVLASPAESWVLDRDVMLDGMPSVVQRSSGKLKLQVVGPGVLAFSWLRDLDNVGAAINFGRQRPFVYRGNRVGEWHRDQFLLEPGMQTLEFGLVGFGSVSSAWNLWLAGFERLPFVSIEEGLGYSGSIAIGPEADSWRGIPSGGHAGGPFLAPKSNAILATVVQGPGVCRFRYLGDYQSPTFSVDGRDVALPVDGSIQDIPRSEWRLMELALTDGPHTLRWGAPTTGNHSSLSVDVGIRMGLSDLEFDSGAGLDASKALDVGDQEIMVFQGVGWVSEAMLSALGGEALVGRSQYPMTTMVTGSGVLRCSVRVEGDQALRLNGDLIVEGPTEGWQQLELVIPDESGAVFTWTVDGVVASGGGVFLDAFEHEVLSPLPWEDGLDGALAWTVPTDLPPVGMASSSARDGEDMTVVGPGEAAWLETSVVGPGTLSFSWKQLVVEGRGLEALFMLDQEGEPLSAPKEWADVSLTLGDGSHELRWEGEGVLDRVAFVPESSPALNQALGLPTARSVRTYGSPGASWHPSAESNLLESGLGVSVFEMLAEGPGLVRFEWQSANRTGIDEMEMLQGASRISLPSPFRWRRDQLLLSGGAQLLRWEVPGEVAAVGSIRNVEFFAEGEVAGAGTAFGEGLSLTTSSVEPWIERQFVGEVSGERVRVVQASASVSGASPSWLEAMVAGPGKLDFSYRCGLAGGVRFLVNGEPLSYLVGGDMQRQHEVYELPVGDHQLRWESTWRDSTGQRVVLLESLMWEAGSASSEDLLGWPDVTKVYSRGPGGGWEVIEEEGTAIVRSGLVERLGRSEFGFEVNGPGVFRFDYKVDAESGNGLLLSYGGLPFGQMDGAVSASGWKEGNLLLGDGAHTLVFAYDQVVQPGATSESEGRAWIRHARLEALPELASAVDVEDLSLRTGGDGKWVPLPVPFAAEGQEVLTPHWTGTSGEVWLEADVVGPGKLHFSEYASLAIDEGLRLEVDGAIVWRRRGQTPHDGWGRHEYFLDSGPHVVRWVSDRGARFSADYAGYRALDAIGFESSVALPVHELLTEHVGFVATEDGGWVLVEGEETPDGDPVLVSSFDEVAGSRSVSGWLPNGNHRVISFWWRASDSSPRLRLSQGDVPVEGEATAWQWGQILVNSDGLAKWTPFFDPSEGDTASLIWIGGLRLNAFDEVSLGEALGAPELAWTTSGTDPWRTVSAAGSSRSLVYSGDWLEATVQGPGEIAFSWQHSKYAWARFFVNGQSAASTYERWQRVRVALPPGQHVLRWEGNPWRYDWGGPFPKARLADVRFDAGGSEMMDALDHGNLETVLIAVSGLEDQWRVSGDVSSDGVDALIVDDSEGEGLGEYSFGLRMRALFPLPALLSYRSIDVAASYQLGEPVWGGESVRLEGSGPGFYDWEVAGSSQHPIAIDRLRISVAGEEGVLGEGADSSAHFTTGGEVPWTVVGAIGNRDGIDMLATSGTGTYGAFLPSWLDVTVAGPGVVRFWWRGVGQWQVNDIVLRSRFDTKAADQAVWEYVEYALPEGEHQLRWVATRLPLGLDGFSFVPSNSQLLFPMWAASHGLSELLSEPMASPATDGVPNLIKFAFGLEPLVSADAQPSAFLPRQQIRPSAFGDRLVLEYVRRKGAALRYKPEFTSDLVEWSSAHEVPEVIDLGNGWERVIVPDAAAVPGAGMRSGRVVVEAP